MNRKLYFIVIVICLAVTGSTLAWVFLWDDLPKKEPVRAKQVFMLNNNIRVS